MIQVTNAISAIPSPHPAGNDGLQVNLRGLSWEPVMLTDIRAR
jgi:hypothetical protein